MIVYPGGLLGEEGASFEQTRTGEIDINRTNLAPLASFVGKANIFGLPFLFRSANHLHRVLDPFGVLCLPVTMSCFELSSAVADLQAQIDALLALADHVIE